MSAGNLLTYLYSNTSQKVIPNPPGTLQVTIDDEVKNFQRILDGVDMEIQLGQKYLRREIEKKQSTATAATTTTAATTATATATAEPAAAADDEPEIIKEQAPPAAESNTNQEETNTFDLPEDHQGFDNDLDALLDSVGQQQPGQSDDMGGLFGDDFDFIIPDQ